MLFQNDETMEFLKSIIRIGEVSSVDAAKGTARVVFDDFDSTVSYDLQVICRNTFANRDYAMPDIGEDVICIFLPTGTEAGFILGSVYAGEITPPENTINRRCVEFSDGAKFTYDRAAHTFTASIGDTSITINQDSVDVESSDTIHAKIGQTEATISTTGVDVQASGSVHAKVGSTEATVSSAGVSIIGNLTVTGNITATGAATAASVTALGAVTAGASVTAAGAVNAAIMTATGAVTAQVVVLQLPPVVNEVPMIVP